MKLILRAKRPVLYVGGGVIKADAHEELFELATTGQLPVVTTLMARGAFPDSNELCLGMPGMHGNYTAVTAMQKADLLVALGLAVRRPRDRQARRVRAAREDRSTSTSTRPRSGRTAWSTCRSSATART